jgi:hypothetical protein
MISPTIKMYDQVATTRNEAFSLEITEKYWCGYLKEVGKRNKNTITE